MIYEDTEELFRERLKSYRALPSVWRQMVIDAANANGEGGGHVDKEAFERAVEDNLVYRSTGKVRPNLCRFLRRSGGSRVLVGSK